jgi:hypothetical protein
MPSSHTLSFAFSLLLVFPLTWVLACESAQARQVASAPKQRQIPASGSHKVITGAISAAELKVGLGPRGAVVGDFNLDHKADLAVANINSNDVTILLGNGGGSFSPAAASPVPVGEGPVSIVVGDFNRDGKPDLAVANQFSNNVSILLGNGSGGFTPATTSPVRAGSGPYFVAVSDFNRDGNPDLAVANHHSNNVSILLGNRDGSFKPATASPVSVGVDPRALAVGDVNLDGKPDLVVANYFSNNVTILLGNGSGGFSPATIAPASVGTSPCFVVVNDFNLDNKPDLVVVNFRSNDLTVLLGDGSGGFSAAADSPVRVGAGPVSAAAGDFNLDNRADLAVVNLNSNSVSILLGNGGGGFSAARGLPIRTGINPRSIVVGDFRLRGLLDLAVVNFYSNDVSIRLNLCEARECSEVSFREAPASDIFQPKGKQWVILLPPRFFEPASSRTITTSRPITPD